MSTLREQMRAVLNDPDIDEEEAALDALMAVVEPALHKARNVQHGRCRSCSGILDRHMLPGRPEWAYGHRTHCRLYVGPLEHRWVRTKVIGMFGGVDHHCVCGGWFRLGGLAGHGDGTDTATAVCPNADQDWRGPREATT